MPIRTRAVTINAASAIQAFAPIEREASVEVNALMVWSGVVLALGDEEVVVAVVVDMVDVGSWLYGSL